MSSTIKKEEEINESPRNKERKRLNKDFEGEFPEVRRSGLSVDADSLIRGSSATTEEAFILKRKLSHELTTGDNDRESLSIGETIGVDDGNEDKEKQSKLESSKKRKLRHLASSLDRATNTPKLPPLFKSTEIDTGKLSAASKPTTRLPKLLNAKNGPQLSNLEISSSPSLQTTTKRLPKLIRVEDSASLISSNIPEFAKSPKLPELIIPSKDTGISSPTSKSPLHNTSPIPKSDNSSSTSSSQSEFKQQAKLTTSPTYPPRLPRLINFHKSPKPIDDSELPKLIDKSLTTESSTRQKSPISAIPLSNFPLRLIPLQKIGSSSNDSSTSLTSSIPGTEDIHAPIEDLSNESLKLENKSDTSKKKKTNKEKDIEESSKIQKKKKQSRTASQYRGETSINDTSLKGHEREEDSDDDDNDDDDQFFDANDIEALSADAISQDSKPIDSSASGVSESIINVLKDKIYKKITGRLDLNPYELESKVDELYDIISSTITNGARHSCFILGPRSSGKSKAIELALNRARTEIDSKKSINIRINGNAQLDDKLAVRHIAEQLDREISRVYGVKLNETDANDFLNRKSITNTFSNILKILADELDLRGNVSKLKIPIIFIIEEVEVYANQSRQTLLYNILDLVQNSPTPISVLCCTQKITVKESLEKRVRSRFSQRVIQFGNFDREKFIHICGKILNVDQPQNEYEIAWNESIGKLLEKPSRLRRSIVMNHLTISSVAKFQTDCFALLNNVDINSPFLRESSFVNYERNQQRSSWVSVINELSDIELSLLICASRIIAKTELHCLNLNMVYEEYKSCLQDQRKGATSVTMVDQVITTTEFKQWKKENCKLPWEQLQLQGFLSKPGGVNSRTNQQFGNVSYETKDWQLEVTIDELRKCISHDRIVRSWTRL
ncbi:hypothetical protein WICMUC_004135 [Wickerhamomyces mucosus]|uniref:Origin recognition complex subunit 4 C-terminal domain-containing protein n=1 Tax=Wickerhamomyces mucosus TaxID=1378264 RepID=A0A9P8PJV0_9ASCO|nr:hypothetical protein WICMUC_004135 [Wickerhamomyces mucosus]